MNANIIICEDYAKGENEKYVLFGIYNQIQSSENFFALPKGILIFAQIFIENEGMHSVTISLNWCLEKDEKKLILQTVGEVQVLDADLPAEFHVRIPASKISMPMTDNNEKCVMKLEVALNVDGTQVGNTFINCIFNTELLNQRNLK